MAAYTAGFMALVTCGLTAEDRHQLWNPALVLRQTASDVGGPYSIPGEWNAQNVITWSLSDRLSALKVSPKSVFNFFSYPAHRPTHRTPYVERFDLCLSIMTTRRVVTHAVLVRAVCENC